ncbi:NUDIX domain-containing protein [Candidatus Uhrbacteria bacterium]|jgi:8-oxo-dGTP diphosphatase|nr:NUDIX domain-containing protein [Candidatus Uhrbacteria bacterium]MBT7716783.1 NUDIX domain-containing protein [Candidatus Uhrbacteria bacterium]
MENIAIGIVRNRQGQVLIIRRKNPEESPHLTKLFWAFPGGRPEQGESLEETVIREIKEETDIDVKINHLLSTRLHPEFPVHATYFACHPINQAQKPVPDNKETIDARWVIPDQLEKYFTTNLSPDVIAYLR